MNIEKCPIPGCGGKCKPCTDEETGITYVHCSIQSCAWCMGEMATVEQAINIHNHISQCVRAFEGVDVGKVMELGGGKLLIKFCIAKSVNKREADRFRACIKDGE